jgi:hypothetical protein
VKLDRKKQWIQTLKTLRHSQSILMNVIPSRALGKPYSGSIGPVSTRQCQSVLVSARLSPMVRAYVRISTKDILESRNKGRMDRGRALACQYDTEVSSI